MTDPTIAAILAAIRETSAEATPGEWVVRRGYNTVVMIGPATLALVMSDADAALAAHEIARSAPVAEPATQAKADVSEVTAAHAGEIREALAPFADAIAAARREAFEECERIAWAQMPNGYQGLPGHSTALAIVKAIAARGNDTP